MSQPASNDRCCIVIVDDEPLAREGLRNAIARLRVPDVEVIALCEDGVTALDRIREFQPEILLLDIAMPILDGFAMLEQLEPEGTPPAVVFVTAYDEHAVRAFDAAALDFLVKPVSDERLRAALQRAVRRVAEARANRAALGARQPPLDTAERYLRQIVIPDRGRHLVVPVDEIEWIQGDTYYVRVHAGGRERLYRERLSRLEVRLDPEQFHRTHRSALVRLDLIRELRAESPYSFSALLSTGARVPVSRERLKPLEARLRR
ncbi:MAG TPA: LytTR family DNA-binding domain-containing protein [Gemmatimonadaceae bacterium]